MRPRLRRASRVSRVLSRQDAQPRASAFLYEIFVGFRSSNSANYIRDPVWQGVVHLTLTFSAPLWLMSCCKKRCT